MLSDEAIHKDPNTVVACHRKPVGTRRGHCYYAGCHQESNGADAAPPARASCTMAKIKMVGTEAYAVAGDATTQIAQTSPTNP